MNTNKQDWRDSRHVMGLSTGWAIFGVALIFALAGVIWGGSVLLSDVTGAGGAIKQKNSTVNRIQQQANFEDLVTTYQGYLVKVKLSKTALAAASTTIDKQIAQTNLQGISQACVDTAQEFNADSAKYLARDWKSAGLPLTLDANACS